MTCLAADIPLPTRLCFRGYLHSPLSSLYLSVTKRGAVVTAKARLDAMSAKIVQAAEQGRPLLLFTQRLPIIKLGNAGCLRYLY